MRNTPIARRLNLSRQLQKTQPLIDAMDEMAKRHGVTIAQVAINWVIYFHGETIVAIPGASKVEHARDAAAVMSFRLTDEEMDRLDQLSRQYR